MSETRALSKETPSPNEPSAAGPPWAMTLPQLWASLSVALPVVAALAAANRVRDFGYQIRVGEIFLRTGTIVRHNPFTFTARGVPWLNQQWGADVLFALLYRAGGWTAPATSYASGGGNRHRRWRFRCTCGNRR